ncbi:histidinol-phosphate aminotransferase [Candidatus Methylomirabilis lanthanidiphila]|uniref:Histidinol-phosphate aminotransferase n=1 Tax=Candidatus Methylomirabilis lanthanidiphila TaxID=2211376 RepID=A0A564ZMW0_9BACT|nr:histidinol-phosphate aminotransferase [Candidatus Methylomirabilis lanthanidiphila]
MASSFEDAVSPYLKGLPSYRHGRPFAEGGRGPVRGDWVKLDYNENPLGPSPLAVKAIQDLLHGINRYPDCQGQSLKGRLAERLGLSPAHIALGNGSSELIDLCARCFLSPGTEAIMGDPAFAFYGRVVHAAGSQRVSVPLHAFCHDLKAMTERITPRTRMVFIGNPNNPTGSCVPPHDITAFVEALPAGIIILIDEAYREYLPDELQPGTVRYVKEGRPVIALRSFSKIYGLSGLRIGYAIAPPECIALLDKARQPFNVNLLAGAAALAALDDDTHLAGSKRLNEAGKQYLYQAFEALGLRYVPTAANFILVDVEQDGEQVVRALAEKRVAVCPLTRYGLPTSLRITIGAPRDNERFIALLREVLSTR